MANVIFTTSNANTNTTALRAFGSAISGGLEDVLTISNKVASTIDWSTVTHPGGVGLGSVIGYEVWKLDDPSPTACDVYMKFEYRTNIQLGGTVIIFLYVGTGWQSNNLTGPGGLINQSVMLNAQRSNTSGYDASLTESWMSSDGDGFTWLHSVNTTASSSTNSRFLLVVDRQRNPNGAAQSNAGWPGTGFIVARHYSYPYPTIISVDPVQNTSNTTTPYGEYTTYSKWPIIAPTGYTALSSDGEKTIVSPMWIVNRQGSYTSKMLVSVPANDINSGNLFDINFLGASRKYKGSSQYTSNIQYNLNSGSSAAIWWEDN